MNQNDIDAMNKLYTLPKREAVVQKEFKNIPIPVNKKDNVSMSLIYENMFGDPEEKEEKDEDEGEEKKEKESNPFAKKEDGSEKKEEPKKQESEPKAPSPVPVSTPKVEPVAAEPEVEEPEKEAETVEKPAIDDSQVQALQNKLAIQTKIQTLQKQYNDLVVTAFQAHAAECVRQAIEDFEGPLGENIHQIVGVALEALRKKVLSDFGIETGGDGCGCGIGGTLPPMQAPITANPLPLAPIPPAITPVGAMSFESKKWHKGGFSKHGDKDANPKEVQGMKGKKWTKGQLPRGEEKWTPHKHLGRDIKKDNEEAEEED